MQAGGSHIASSVVTAGDGLWFVQWGDNSGDYLHTEWGGSVTGKAVEQGVAADFADLAAGKWVRVGFTPLGTGQTVYSKETQVRSRPARPPAVDREPGTGRRAQINSGQSAQRWNRAHGIIA